MMTDIQRTDKYDPRQRSRFLKAVALCYRTGKGRDRIIDPVEERIEFRAAFGLAVPVVRNVLGGL